MRKFFALIILIFFLGLLAAFSEKEEEKDIITVQTPGPAVIVAAGDIACGPDSREDADCKEWETSELIRKIDPTALLTLGDNQYESAPREYFNGDHPFCKSDPPHCYGSTWGRFKDITFPGIGNHEYSTLNAAGYFDYFNGGGNFSGPAGDRDKGYYSFNIGSWHLIALNSNCIEVGGCGIDSPQVKWLRDDLERYQSKCTLAFWHSPRFSNGEHGDDLHFDAFWRVLYEAGTEIVLNGHDHHYERFFRLNPQGYIDRQRGIRQFIVGTGGRSLRSLSAPASERLNNETFGLLKLTLYEDRYDWEFVPIEGQTFTDSGSSECH